MQRSSGWWRGGIVVLGAVCGIVLLLIWLAGGFHKKIEPQAAEASLQQWNGGDTITVEEVSVDVFEDCVGTVRAEHETAVGAKIMARVIAVDFGAGQQVKSGQILVQLERSELEARLSQAKAALQASQAALDQALTDYERVLNLHNEGSASDHEFNSATNTLNSARANKDRAQSSLAEAEAILEFATIRSPLDGVVIDKLVSVGDMVKPGQTVARLYDRLQLEAPVRESLATRLQVGQELPVTLEALDLHCHGKINEVVPESDVLSRAFLVKVTGPCPAGVIPGMFGRLSIPLGERKEIRIPQSAVTRVGQLAYVHRIVDGGHVERSFVRLAGRCGNDFVVASGLATGDVIAARP